MNNTQVLEMFGKIKRYSLIHRDCIRRGGSVVAFMAERKRKTVVESNSTLAHNETTKLTHTEEENMEVYLPVAITTQKDGYVCMHCGLCNESAYLKC
jgi:hypothetical protein